MPNKPRRIKRSRDIDRDTDGRMVMRFVDVQRDSLNTTDQTVRVVIASENPVQRYDDSRGITVSEVLLMDGIVFRGDRTQIPIVDSHNRSTVANVLGSVRNLHVEGDELIGDASFARDARSQEAFQKMMDGHLSDFSITAAPQEVGFVERGKTYTTRSGAEVIGPADIVTRWMPTDASICATGADERSTVRRSYTDIPEFLERNMDQSLLASLVELGMPSDLSEPNTVLAWVVGNLNAGSPAPAPADAIENADEEPESVATDESEESEMIENMDPEGADMATIEKSEDEKVERALKADQVRRNEIQATCKKVGIEREFADQLCDSGISVAAAMPKIIERISTKPAGQSVEGSGNVDVKVDERDKFMAAARDGLVQRAFQSAGVKRSAFEGDSRPAAGSEDFQNSGLRRMSERFVERMGGNINRMAPKDIALVALGHPGAMNRWNIQREAYHTTGSFANLLLDAANKTLLAGYEEAPFTWSMWARQASSTPDFKNINRIRFSESPDLEVVPENKSYDEGPMSDSKESYSVEKFGRIFTVTWETIVNDDMDAISRIPAMQGSAARRTQNKKVYETLTANAAMADGVALFDAGHSNVGSPGAAPSVPSLNDAFTKMRTQKGLDGKTIINVMPRYLIVPAALEATALELFTSTGRPDQGGDTTGNSGVQNIYGPGGRRSLQVITEPELDGSSSTAWYVAAENTQIDTVELAFLQGEETPVLENEWDFDKDVYKYKVRQTFGVKAIDWRGVFRNAGA